jgi:hypothetical protein
MIEIVDPDGPSTSDPVLRLGPDVNFRRTYGDRGKQAEQQRCQGNCRLALQYTHSLHADTPADIPLF